MSNEIKPHRLLVVEDNPGDYVLPEQYLKGSKLSIEKVFHAARMAEPLALIKENIFTKVNDSFIQLT